MLKEWCKYRYGIFPENGFTGDSLYPTTYQEGNTTLASQGCIQQDILCPLGKSKIYLFLFLKNCKELHSNISFLDIITTKNS